jgi:hypothetical protein
MGVYDDANWVSFGGAGAFVPHKTIHMLGEDVNIEMFDDKIHVRVFFSFENKGDATAVKMAFPFEGTQYEDWFQLYRFATKVDGQAVPVEKVEIPTFTRQGKDFLKYGDTIAKSFVLVKQVSFDKGQRRTVLVDYVVKRGFAGINWAFDSYVLHTGATWAGPIEHCTITVDWSKVKTMGKPDLEFRKEDETLVPSEWTYTAPRVATTTLLNIEPDYDLSLTSVGGFWHVTLNGKTLDSGHGAYEDGGMFSGNWPDPQMFASGFEDFFADVYSYERGFISGPVANAFGNALTLEGKTKLRDGFGKTHTLKRAATPSKRFLDDFEVYLKDVVEALGGSYTWVAEWERIDITMPTREKPLRKKGDPVPPPRG